jgi:hypothetical protein
MPTTTLPTLTTEEVEAAWGRPFKTTAQHCHAVSIAIVQSGVLGQFCRVARGACQGVPGQHSWVVVGRDCYDQDAPIIDATLWSYDPTVSGVWSGTLTAGHHRPHGAGSIWTYGRPPKATSQVIELTPRQPFSPDAELFLELLGPLDLMGWAILAHCPVEGWPAGEILDAMYHTDGLAVHIPIDLLGMVTDINPDGLYLPGQPK